MSRRICLRAQLASPASMRPQSPAFGLAPTTRSNSVPSPRTGRWNWVTSFRFRRCLMSLLPGSCRVDLRRLNTLNRRTRAANTSTAASRRTMTGWALTSTSLATARSREGLFTTLATATPAMAFTCRPSPRGRTLSCSSLRVRVIMAPFPRGCSGITAIITMPN